MCQRILLAIDKDGSYGQPLAEAWHFAASSDGVLGIIHVHHDANRDISDSQAILQEAKSKGDRPEWHLLKPKLFGKPYVSH